MKASDTPDVDVLRILAKRPGVWHSWGDGSSMPSISPAFGEGVPFKVKLAKMRKLIRRGLVEGCTCGCRGDFEITTKGKILLAASP